MGSSPDGWIARSACPAGLVPWHDRVRAASQPHATWRPHVRELDQGRTLRRAPAETPAALHRARVLTLALGAGGTAAIYSITQTLLLDPLPIVREDEIGRFGCQFVDRSRVPSRQAEFAGFEKVGAYRPTTSPSRCRDSDAAAAGHRGDVGAVRCSRHSARLGRTFQSGDDLAASEPVVVLSDGEWQETRRRSPLVGTRLQIGGLSTPWSASCHPDSGFPLPRRAHDGGASQSERRAGQDTLVGRIARGESMAHMEGPLRALAARLGAAFPYPNPLWDREGIRPSRPFARRSWATNGRGSLPRSSPWP